MMSNRKTSDPSLCWNCGKYAGGCSWSDHLEPVKGWTAESTQEGKTWHVKACPEYKRGSKVQCTNTDAAERLVIAAAKAHVDDYAFAIQDFRSKPGSETKARMIETRSSLQRSIATDLVDAEVLIKAAEEKADEM